MNVYMKISYVTTLVLFCISSLTHAQEIPNSSELSLKKEYKEITHLSSKHIFSIGLGNFTPNGHAYNSDQTQYELSNLGSALMPILAYGWTTDIQSLAEFAVNYGMYIEGAYAELYSSNGKLSNSTFTLQPSMKVHWRSSEKIMTRVRAEVGSQTMSLSKSGNLIPFDRQAYFIGYGLGLEWIPKIESRSLYSFFIDYNERTGLTSDQNWVPYTSTLDLGISYYW